MSDDPLDYEAFFEKAKRGIVRDALAVVAKQGLPGKHFFHITFRTDHPGVQMPKFLRLQYPREMAIILQNIFQDLEVEEDSFSVTLSFNQVLQRLTVPFAAILLFRDESAEFAIGFNPPDGWDGAGETGEPTDEGAPAAADVEADAGENAPPVTEKDGNVIKVDRFRKRRDPASSNKS